MGAGRVGEGADDASPAGLCLRAGGRSLAKKKGLMDECRISIARGFGSHTLCSSYMECPFLQPMSLLV